MKIITGSLFWIFGLVVIFNSIELSSQSGTPRLQGHGLPRPRAFHPGPLPFRKVRCPTSEQLRVDTLILMKDANGNYVNCTQDKILLAIGPLIIGHILDDVIHPISGMFGNEIVYDESTNKQTSVGRGYLKEHYGVFGPVPAEALRLSEIHPFGMYNATRPRSPTRPNSSTRPSSTTLARSTSVSGSMFGYDSDSSTSSSSSATSRSSSRSSKSFFSRIFSRSSSRSSRPPSSGASSPGKK